MGIDASALIGALTDKIGQCPDVSTDAVQKMSDTGKTAIQAQIPGTFRPGHGVHSPPGTLANSVEMTYFSPGVVAMSHVAPTAVYSRIQELGGVSGAGYRSHLPPRPYVAPAIEESMGAFEDDAVDAIRDLFW